MLRFLSWYLISFSISKKCKCSSVNVTLNRHTINTYRFVKLHLHPNIPLITLNSWWITFSPKGLNLRLLLSAPFFPTYFLLWLVLVSIEPAGCTQRSLLTSRHTLLSINDTPQVPEAQRCVDAVSFTAFSKLTASTRLRASAFPPCSLSISSIDCHAGKISGTNLWTFRLTKPEEGSSLTLKWNLSTKGFVTEFIF